MAAALDDWTSPRPGPVVVIDPACGDGRFLLAASAALAARGVAARLVGIDVDPEAADAASANLVHHDAVVVEADALAPGVLERIAGGPVDLAVGNPPFLSPLAARNAQVASSSPAGAPYADAAAQFLLHTWRALATGGRVGFVLPQSVLANRDAGFVRDAVADEGTLRWLWWSPRRVFDASVRTCAVVAQRDRPGGRRPDALAEPLGSVPRPVPRASSMVRRQFGPDFGAAPEVAPVGADWGELVADLGGVPPTSGAVVRGTLGDHATSSAGFRDEFYGVAAAVGDDVDGPPLVTSGLIDPAVCRWGQRPVRVARRSYATPRVDLDRLTPNVRRWADRQLVPKVLVASQTKVIEAVADPAGAWLPGVPVVSVVPTGTEVDVWMIAAALTNPVAASALVRAATGSGLSAVAVRVSARGVSAVPWPDGDLRPAAACLRAGDVAGCGRLGLHAYGLDPDHGPGAALWSWWSSSLPASQRSLARP